MNVIKKLVFTIGIILSATNILLGTEVFAEYYKNDITPPWGRIYIEGAAERNGTTYVTDTALNLKIYAKDDMCKDSEIKYYMSTTSISDTSKLDDNLWKTYVAGETVELTLNEDGTKQIYSIFKDANGNTSLIYEANTNTTQEIIFNANGGTKAPTGVNTNRILGMSYIIPNQESYKSGYKFLGWSTDSKANVASYKAGDAIPPDASLGNGESVVLYAIYGSDLSEYPDLVDVVEIGDYVNYPVAYNNVETRFDENEIVVSGYVSILNGWRVLSSDKETGRVTLVSAGVPLTTSLLDGKVSVAASKMESTSEFLNIGTTGETEDIMFLQNGFLGYKSLISAFTNKYTVINSGIPEVRSMTKEDVDSVYQYFGGTGITVRETPVNDPKFKDMLAIPSTIGKWSYYKLATISDSDSNAMWYVNGNDSCLFYNSYPSGVRPVVTLKANIKAIGQDIDGVWNITTDDEIIRKPEIKKGRFAYNGNEQTLLLKNLNTDKMEITGTTKATEVGTYTATINLKDTAKTTWTDGTTTPITIEWKIADKLIDIVEVGDYVNYPVEYENVPTWTIDKYTSKLNGWRVLKTNKDTDEITLISAGVPLALFKNNSNAASTVVSNLSSTSKFLNIGFTTSEEDGKFTRSGFEKYGIGTEGLIKAFTNEYTVINSGVPAVRAMTKDDLDYLYQYFGGTGITDHLTSIDDAKFKDMLAIPSTTSGNCAYYYIAYAPSNTYLRIIDGTYGFTNYTLNSVSGGIRPVVTLTTDIKVTGEDLNGAWNIDV